MKVLPITAIIPTLNRSASLARTLESLEKQGALPAELVVIDGSTDPSSQRVVEEWNHRLANCSVVWQAAKVLGAAAQRNQGVAIASQPFVCFLDDDILFEPDCLERMWKALAADQKLGAVNAMIINQRYQSPGFVSRTLFRLLHGRSEVSYAGMVLGPAVNLLPEDREDLPEVVPVCWLNTTCTLYRGEALPRPPFDLVFTGYSMMEDLALSLRVGTRWRLANARTARIFHDSQPGPHKSDISAMARMELVNRHYVMTVVLNRRRLLDYLRLFLWEIFQLSTSTVRSQSRSQMRAICWGKFDGLRQIYFGSRRGLAS